MDPYKNWGNDLDSSDSYYPSSSRDKPVRRSSKDLGTGKRSSVSSLGGADVYDFDIDGDSDEFNSSPDTKTSTFRSSRESASGKRSSTSDVFKMTSTATSFNYESNKYTMRKSTDERMKEILESNKKAAAESSKAANRSPSIEDAWKDIVEGVGQSPDPSPKARSDFDHRDDRFGPDRRSNTAAVKQPINSPGSTFSGDSSFGDSLDISAADLEVGAIAARRTKEKVSERKRRMSIPLHEQQYSDQAMKSVAPAKTSASPDVHMRNKHRETEQPQMSAALSSIYVSKEGGTKRDSGVSLQYGSVEKSDGDLYNMLASSAPNINTSFRSSNNNMSDVSGGEDTGNDDDSGSDIAVSHAHGTMKGVGNKEERKSPLEYSDDDFEQEENENEKKEAPAVRRDSVEEIKQRWFTSAPVEKSVISTVSVAVESVSEPEKSTLFDNPDIRASLNIKSIDAINDVIISDGDAVDLPALNDENAATETHTLDATLPDQQQSIVEYDRSNSTIYPPPPSSGSNSMVSEMNVLATNIANASEVAPAHDVETKPSTPPRNVQVKRNVASRYDDSDGNDSDDKCDNDVSANNNSKVTVNFVQNVLPIAATQMFRYSRSEMELDDDMQVPLHEDVKGKRKMRTIKATSSRGTYTKTIIATKENNVKGCNTAKSNVSSKSKANSKNAASTLAKVNQKFKSSKPVTAVVETAGLQQPPVRSISNRRGASSNPTADAAVVSRLEEGTRKLAKQFEELEREMKSLKTNKSEMEAQIRSNITRSNMSLVNGNSNQNTPVRPRLNESKVILKRKDIEALENSTMSKFDRKSFEGAALDTIKMLAAKGETLHEKEKGILQREEEVSLRESLARAALLDTLQINIHTDHKVISDQEFQQMKQKEASLNAEIDKLKATIFELSTEKAKFVNELHKVPSRFLDFNKSSVKKASIGDGTNDEDKGETITILKSEYDSLLLEVQTQEQLLVGFQKENERLVKEQKIHLAEDASRKAEFFDQQEQLNKELNRLRNVVVGDNITTVSITRKSVDQFRAELDADATVRALRERLAMAEAGAGVREKELQVTIDKIRADYRQLITENNFLTNSKAAGSSTEQQVVENLARKHKEEIDQLHEKLAWYAENQQLIEDVERVKVELSSSIATLKKELKKRGMSINDMKHLLETTIVHKDDTNNETTTMSTTKSSFKRNPADIKKIKDLEKTIADLQDSLMRRNPDSVASLIQAAKESDSVQIERKNNSDDVAAMKKEVADLKEIQEKRLRSLRQEHEKVKTQYEKRISDLHAMAPSLVTSSPAINQQKTKVGNATNAIKSLPQAISRIKELEDEIEKVRAFYSKRVDEIQRKAESQMRALKRGDAEGDDDDEVLIEIEEQFKRRIAILEEELLSQAEELGKATRENVENKNEIMQLKGSNLLERTHLLPPVPPALESVSSAVSSNISIKSPEDIEKEIQDRLSKMMREFRENERSANQNQGKSNSTIEQQLREEKDLLMQKLMDEREASSKERGHLTLRLREEELRASGLSSEVINLRSRLSQPSTPQMAQFVRMENQILQLESRLQRRERELISAIDEVKIAAKMELGRLQAIHMQELRSKDEELVRFQNELEDLVSSLKSAQQQGDEFLVIV